MFEKVQLWSIGAAAIIDTVLLLAILEPRNRQWVRVPVAVMLAGAWLWHWSLFFHLLMPQTAEWAHALQRVCLLGMAAGLLLMPCGLVHASIRLWRFGLTLLPRPDPRHLLAYLPLLALIPIALHVDPQSNGLRESALGRAYVIGVAVINVAACVLFLNLRRRIETPQAQQFFRIMTLVLPSLSALHLIVFLLLPRDSLAWDGGLLLCELSPAVPALLFGYFVVRFNFLQLVVERSFVYGAILAGVILFHQLAFQDLSAAIPERARVPLVFLEGLLLGVLMLGYRPLRQRLLEAVHYLTGARTSQVREKLRQLAMQLSVQTGRPPLALLNWFAAALRRALDVEYVSGWLIDPDNKIRAHCGDADRLSDDQVMLIYAQMRLHRMPFCTRRDVPSAAILDCLQTSKAHLAVLKVRPNIAGMMLLSRRSHHPELGEEEINAILLLVEQLATTIDNNLLQAERLAAEHCALQNEKLSALGLVASAIAHELKNPLSAIKTIAAVLAEELGPEHARAEDVRMIRSEVERLASTTSQFLDLARPRGANSSRCQLDEVIGGTMRLLGHLARQQNIDIQLHVADALSPARADPHSLREIFFNLLSNSLEAAGPGGRVTVHCHQRNGSLITEVCDDGPGLPAEVREHLFEPFLTTKPSGTGLGLYVVGRRVGELGGEISCTTGPDRGTTFTVKLPYEDV